MRHAAQVELARTLLSYVAERSTFSSAEPFANPVAAYADAAGWRAERRALFSANPVVVALSSQLATAGDWTTFDLPDRPLLVVRGEDGRARCFLNACRHRGAMLATEPCGHARTLTCPFHAWVFGLDGSLAGIPDPAGFPSLGPADFALRELPCTERFGLVWANAASGDALDASLDDALGAFLGAPLVDELDSYGFDRYHHFRSTAIPVAANWKLMYDTFLEFYHGTYLHRATLAKLLARNVVHFDRLGEHWRMAAAKKSLRELTDQPEDRWRVLDHAVVSYDIFPNLAMNAHGDHVAIYRILPGADVSSSVWHFSLLTPEPIEEGSSAERYFAKNFDYIVATGMEDVEAACGIERTLRSGANDTLLYGGFEPVLSWFHQRVAHELAGAAVG